MAYKKCEFKDGETVITAETLNKMQDAICEMEQIVENHPKDKNNPHGVTAEQVGAHPNTWMPTAEQIGARPNTWMPSAQEVDATPASHAEDKTNPHGVTADQVGARPDTWLPTIAEIGAAPAGYGLGTASSDRTIYSSAQLDALHNSNGWFIYAGGGTDQILTGDSGNINYAYGRVDVFDSTEAKMTLIPHSSQGHGLTTLERYYRNGGWSDWEWVNPPMTPGVEYRTTERHNGKPVYAYTLPLKTLPNATNNDVSHDIANIDKVISCTGTASDGRTLPFYGKYTKIHLSAIKTAVCVYTETDESAITGTATIKYTKTTD